MNPDAAMKLAKSLMAEHGLIEKGWQFKFDRAKRRFGLCSYKRQTISLSLHLTLLNDEEHVKDTIIHEIAHALAPRGAHHGPEWKAVARSLGHSGERCYSDAVEAPAHTWIGTCPYCGLEIQRHRRRQIACRRCVDLGVPWHRAEFVWREA